jgi:hypothetical protein
MASPLFPNFSERQRLAAEALRDRLLHISQEAQEMASRGVSFGERAKTLSMLIRQAMPRRGITRYAANRLRSLWDVMSVAGQGPLGDVVQALLRPQGKPLGTPEQELTALLNLAAELIQSFGGKAQLPEWAQSIAQQRAADREARNRAETMPEEFGYRMTEPRGRNVTSIPAPDRERRVPASDDEMILVNSSNVYAIGYRVDEQNPAKGTLLVRYWSKENGLKTGPGPTYAYFNVPRQVFEAFRLAASKGKFVWDRIRIRGTVSGHKFAYRLVGLGPNGYVPRQATRYGDKEYFIGRTVTSMSGQKYRSTKPDQLVRRLNSRQLARFRTMPNRGTPNRGK